MIAVRAENGRPQGPPIRIHFRHGSALVAVLAVFVMNNCGALTGVVTELVQRAVAGHVASPPPLTVAVLVKPGDATATVGVTGMVKLVTAFTPRPTATVQVTVWPATVQLAGIAPMVKLAGRVSVIVATAVVAAVPVFCTCSE